MTFTYTWANSEQTSLKREDAEGNIAFVPANSGNRDYAAFLASGETAADYVEPPAYVDSRTNAEKLEAAIGLTVTEIRAILAQDSASDFS